MGKRHLSARLAIMLLMCALRTPCAAGAAGKIVSSKELENTIAKVRSLEPRDQPPKPSHIDQAADAAEHLADITRGIDSSVIGDKTLANIVDLLDTTDDGVRYWVAASLGHIGPRAMIAVPKLLHILAEVQCQQWDLSSEASIIPALKKIGVAPPPPGCRKR